MSDVQAAVLALLPRLSCSPSATPLATTAEDVPGELQQAQDLLVRAKTGTGKTLAFLIPALEGRLRALESFAATYKQDNPDASITDVKKALAGYAKSTVGALILSPTRELAVQIANEAIALTSHLPQFGVRLLVGGASRSMQLREWSRSPSNDIVVATPGRCVDMLQSEASVRRSLETSRMLILDEADTLLDMGFADDIATVTNHLPDSANRQTFLFSATVSKQIEIIARKALKKDHVYVDTVPVDDVATHLHIPQFHTVLPSAEDQIVHILRLLAHDQLLRAREAVENGGVGGGKAVIFLPTTRLTQLFSLILSTMKNHLPWGRDTRIIEIHSKKSQEQRTHASDQFRKNGTGYSILVTSDVSARGVDYPGVTRVIQVGVPTSRDIYIHRVGRTGRAGKSGRGDLVLLPWEVGFLSWQLNDIPLKPFTVGEAQRQLQTLAEEYDAAPPTPGALPAATVSASRTSSFGSRDRRDRGRSERPLRATAIQTPIVPRLDTLTESLKTNVLPTIDDLSINETFTSMLGYYIMKAHELRTTKEVVLTGVKNWTVEAMGLEEPPHVSAQFLAKLGMNDGRTKNRQKPRSTDRGFYLRDSRDREGSSRSWEGRGRQRSRDQERDSAPHEFYRSSSARGSGGGRDGGFRGDRGDRVDRGDRGDRGDRERRRAPSFGYGGSSSPFEGRDDRRRY